MLPYVLFPRLWVRLRDKPLRKCRVTCRVATSTLGICRDCAIIWRASSCRFFFGLKARFDFHSPGKNTGKNYMSDLFLLKSYFTNPEIMELLRNDVWQSRKTRKFGHFFGPSGHKFGFSEKLTEIVSKSFLTSFRTFFPFFSTTNRSRDIRGGGCSNTPPPVGDGKSGVPVGRGLNLILIFCKDIFFLLKNRFFWFQRN